VKEGLAWTRPPHGFAKLNVDGAFTAQHAGVGMALRDHGGEVIFTACRHLDTCMDALEAELAAIEEGIKLALHWSALKIIVETDCADAVELIGGKMANLSAYAFRITTIRELLRERDTVLVKIHRSCNSVGHELAKLGRTQARTELWLSSFPPEAAVPLRMIVILLFPLNIVFSPAKKTST
jgi:ribonuclease HI